MYESIADKNKIHFHLQEWIQYIKLLPINTDYTNFLTLKFYNFVYIYLVLATKDYSVTLSNKYVKIIYNSNINLCKYIQFMQKNRSR